MCCTVSSSPLQCWQYGDIWWDFDKWLFSGMWPVRIWVISELVNLECLYKVKVFLLGLGRWLNRCRPFLLCFQLFSQISSIFSLMRAFVQLMDISVDVMLSSSRASLAAVSAFSLPIIPLCPGVQINYFETYNNGTTTTWTTTKRRMDSIHFLVINKKKKSKML